MQQINAKYVGLYPLHIIYDCIYYQNMILYVIQNQMKGRVQYKKIKILALFDGLLKQLNIRYHNTSSKFHIWELGPPENKNLRIKWPIFFGN